MGKKKVGENGVLSEGQIFALRGACQRPFGAVYCDYDTIHCILQGTSGFGPQKEDCSAAAVIFVVAAVGWRLVLSTVNEVGNGIHVARGMHLEEEFHKVEGAAVVEG